MNSNSHFETIDLMTGQACGQVMDQLPAVANGVASRVIALGLAGAAVFLATGLSPDVPAPRVGQSSTMQTVAVSNRAKRRTDPVLSPNSFRSRA